MLFEPFSISTYMMHGSYLLQITNCMLYGGGGTVDVKRLKGHTYTMHFIRAFLLYDVEEGCRCSTY